MKNIILILAAVAVVVVIPTTGWGQNTLAQGDVLFDAGKYDEAKAKYNTWKMNGSARLDYTDTRIAQCNECVRLLSIADFLWNDGKQTEAAEQYRKVLLINPNDSTARARAGNSATALASTVSNDWVKMNLHGKVQNIVERSYYSYTDRAESLVEAEIEGGLFDGSPFLAVTYGWYHLAGMPFNHFLLQVSDCDIMFNSDGYATNIKSIWPNGGNVRLYYDNNNNLVEQDARFSEARNQDGGLIKYNYDYADGLITKISRLEESGYESIKRNEYDQSNNLIREVISDGGITYFYEYVNGNLAKVILRDFDGPGRDTKFEFVYDDNNNIAQITAIRGDNYDEAVTTFIYEYDDKNNWIVRYGKIMVKGEDSLPKEIDIKTTREIRYY